MKGEFEYGTAITQYDPRKSYQSRTLKSFEVITERKTQRTGIYIGRVLNKLRKETSDIMIYTNLENNIIHKNKTLKTSSNKHLKFTESRFGTDPH